MKTNRGDVMNLGMVIVFALCLSIGSIGFAKEPPATGFEATVRKFSAERHRLAQDLSSRLKLPLPGQADLFFQEAVTGRWESVSNAFENVKQQKQYGTAIPQLNNELWAPIHETVGIWEVWVGWKEDSSLLALFYEPILSSMPKGSIYFGGTDCGRFAVTTVNALQNPPRVFCITQNALADNTYMAHLRAFYGGDIWIPKEQDSVQAFQRYVEDVKSGKRGNSSEFKIVDGRVQVSGVMGVMAINGILCEMIFNHNKDAREFFVEESYVIDWMYPYLEPYGLIMKLNSKPSDRLSDEVVARDREFWSRYAELLERQPGFSGNIEARKAFSKLRSAIAGLYAYRKMDKEAEAAFRQAIRLCPESPEANFRYAKMYEEQGRIEDATSIMVKYLVCVPPDSRDNAEEYVKQLKSRVRTSGAE